MEASRSDEVGDPPYFLIWPPELSDLPELFLPILLGFDGPMQSAACFVGTF